MSKKPHGVESHTADKKLPVTTVDELQLPIVLSMPIKYQVDKSSYGHLENICRKKCLNNQDTEVAEDL